MAGAGATVGVAGLAKPTVADHGSGHTITITKDEEGVADGEVTYEFTVSGSVEAGDTAESGEVVDETTARGSMGPSSGTDDFSFTGSITTFSMSGDALVYADGEQVDPATLGANTVVSFGGATVAVDGTTDVPVTLDKAPVGMSGFSLDIGVDTSVATVENAAPADSFDDPGEASVAQDGSTVSMYGVDVTDAVGSGASGVRLATVSIAGVAAGSTTPTLSVNQFDDDEGSAVDVVTQSGDITIGGETGTTLSVGSASVPATGTVDVPVLLDAAPNGISGYRVTLTVDASVATVDTASVGADFDGLSSVNVSDDGSTVTLEGVDVDDTVGPGASGVTLATVSFGGVAEGTTPIDLTVERVDTDEGVSADVSSSDGEVTVEPQAGPPAIGDAQNPPTDPDGDGQYEDVNGNGRTDYDDAVTLFDNLDSSPVTNNAGAFDFDGNGAISYRDLVELVNEL